MQNISQAWRGSPKNRLLSLMLWKNDCYTSTKEVRKLNFMCPAWKKKREFGWKIEFFMAWWEFWTFQFVLKKRKKKSMVEETTSQGKMSSKLQWKNVYQRPHGCQVLSYEVIGRMAAMFWRVHEFCEVQEKQYTKNAGNLYNYL